MTNKNPVHKQKLNIATGVKNGGAEYYTLIDLLLGVWKIKVKIGFPA